MIDFTNKETLITVKVALIRALNSIDNEIGATYDEFEKDKITSDQYNAKFDLLAASKTNMTAIYNEIDKAIGDALTFFPDMHY